MSPEHLECYVAEFTGRHDVRELNTADQLVELGYAMQSKGLSYSHLIAENGLNSGERSYVDNCPVLDITWNRVKCLKRLIDNCGLGVGSSQTEDMICSVAMTVFHLYRLRLERDTFQSLFADRSLTRREIILAAIEDKPFHQLKNGQTWRIGNIEKPNESSVFFALGKTTKSTLQIYDEDRGDFIEEPVDQAPYTYVLVDLEFQVCAIGKRPSIASEPATIAKNLERLLNYAQRRDIEKARLSFVLDRIDDPDEFLKMIEEADEVTEFTIYFSRPNPFDVDQQFHAPMQRLLQQTGGTEGSTTIKNPIGGLKREHLEELTRSAVSTGNRTRARIKTESNSKPIPKHSTGNELTLKVESIATMEEKRTFLHRIRKAYTRVRNRDTDS